MESKEWIARDERDHIEAEVAEGRAMHALFTIVAIILIAIIVYAIVR